MCCVQLQTETLAAYALAENPDRQVSSEDLHALATRLAAYFDSCIFAYTSDTALREMAEKYPEAFWYEDGKLGVRQGIRPNRGFFSLGIPVTILEKLQEYCSV